MRSRTAVRMSTCQEKKETVRLDNVTTRRQDTCFVILNNVIVRKKANTMLLIAYPVREFETNDRRQDMPNAMFRMYWSDPQMGSPP